MNYCIVLNEGCQLEACEQHAVRQLVQGFPFLSTRYKSERISFPFTRGRESCLKNSTKKSVVKHFV
jgi:hypothetical protein